MKITNMVFAGFGVAVVLMGIAAASYIAINSSTAQTRDAAEELNQLAVRLGNLTTNSSGA